MVNKGLVLDRSGHLGIWASGHLGIWASGLLAIWASRHLGFWASELLGIFATEHISIQDRPVFYVLRLVLGLFYKWLIILVEDLFWFFQHLLFFCILLAPKIFPYISGLRFFYLYLSLFDFSIQQKKTKQIQKKILYSYPLKNFWLSTKSSKNMMLSELVKFKTFKLVLGYFYKRNFFEGRVNLSQLLRILFLYSSLPFYNVKFTCTSPFQLFISTTNTFHYSNC